MVATILLGASGLKIWAAGIASFDFYGYDVTPDVNPVPFLFSDLDAELQ